MNSLTRRRATVAAKITARVTRMNAEEGMRVCAVDLDGDSAVAVADAAAQRPVPGVTPYRLQTPLWSDGAEKLRFIYLPAGATAKAQGDGLLDLPVGAALIKTFKLDGRLIETRVNVVAVDQQASGLRWKV